MPEMTRPTSAAPEFVEIVCADREMLDAEFKAIVAANFSTPPPGARLLPGESSAPARVPGGSARTGVDCRDAIEHAYVINAPRRQRSPPALLIRE
jgi:hypothetical protein